MARRTGEGVRIGPITLLTLVSVLLLAVLAMLCITTTHATEAMAQRQADALSQTYELDAFGQALGSPRSTIRSPKAARPQRQPRWSSTAPTSCWKTPPRQAAPATCGPSST